MPERAIIQAPLSYSNRSVVCIDPRHWEERAEMRSRELYERMRMQMGPDAEILHIQQANRARVFFEDGAPRNIMGLLKEFLEIQYQFPKTPQKIISRIRMNIDHLARSNVPIDETIQREIENMLLRMENEYAPNCELELRSWGTVRPWMITDPFPPEPEDNVIWNGKLKTKLNFDNIKVDIAIDEEPRPVHLGEIGIKEERGAMREYDELMAPQGAPGIQFTNSPSIAVQSHEVRPAGPDQIQQAVADSLQSFVGQKITPATQQQVQQQVQQTLTGYGNIYYDSTPITTTSVGNWTISYSGLADNAITYSNLASSTYAGYSATTYTSGDITVTLTGIATSATGYFAPDTYVYTAEDGSYRVSGGTIYKPDVKRIVRAQMKTNLAVASRSRKTLTETVPPNELKARETLRDMISESEWRRYVTNGFIMVRAPQSGRWYQIFNDRRRLKVYFKGKQVEEICIHSDDKCPPTDHVINMKVMVELDEEAVRKGGNISKTAGFATGFPTVPAPKTNLVELFKSVKTA